jgi:hypothetical protein
MPKVVKPFPAIPETYEGAVARIQELQDDLANRKKVKRLSMQRYRAKEKSKAYSGEE